MDNLDPHPEIAVSSAYNNGVAFIFVPNVCNARCSFCYVEPAFSGKARLSVEHLSRARLLFSALRERGFGEVRFTGGEPLLFENHLQLFEAAWQAGLRYRILTNGLWLHDSMHAMGEHPPSQITVSTHLLARLESVFGVHVDIDDYVKGIGAAALLSPVECTIVVHGNETPSEFEPTLSVLHQAGVRQVKLILANVPGSLTRTRDFEQVVVGVVSRWRDQFTIRYSDLEETECRLRVKGFLSIELASLRAHACCVQVGESALSIGGRFAFRLAGLTATEVAEAVDALAAAGEAVSGMPCTAHYGSCPIALHTARHPGA